jgi:hypothetical protein
MRAALVNAMIPCFIGLVMVVYALILRQANDPPVSEQPEAKASEVPIHKNWRFQLWVGVGVFVFGLLLVMKQLGQG